MSAASALFDAKMARLSVPKFVNLKRSIDVYYGDAARDAAMDLLYKNFLQAGNLAFDIGAHVGDRIASFRRCGARVVALEPQNICFEALQILYGDDEKIRLVNAACGATIGQMKMHINAQNPTVSTLASEFILAAKDADGWREQVWDEEVNVTLTNLDSLIQSNGLPQFIKIDVEGFELDVLRGLNHAVNCLSFEFTTIQRALVAPCTAHMESLGHYRFNLALGETQQLIFPQAVDAETLNNHIERLPHAANSGDVYCILN